MTNRERILSEIQKIPEPLLTEVLDFVEFLTRKISSEKTEIANMSETALGKDWLGPEEDRAWQHL